MNVYVVRELSLSGEEQVIYKSFDKKSALDFIRGIQAMNILPEEYSYFLNGVYVPYENAK